MRQIKTINRFRGQLFFFVLLTLVFSLVGASPKAHAQPSVGDILVMDVHGELFQVDPTTGTRTLLSDFGNPTQGLPGVLPLGIAVETTGAILVVDMAAGTASHGALFRVDPTTGTRTLLSDFANPAQGPLGGDPIDVTVEATGAILVSDSLAVSSGALFRMDPMTGTRTLLSDFGNPAQGPLGRAPDGVAVETTGAILVVDPAAGTAFHGALFRVDPTTGTRTLLSDFGNPIQGPLGNSPSRVAIEAVGTILVTDRVVAPGILDVLYRVDPTTGTRTLLSDFGNPAQGPLGGYPCGVAVEMSGAILVADADAGTALHGGLFRMNPTTGMRILLSDFGNLTQGPLGQQPASLTIYPKLYITTTPSPIPLFSDMLAMIPLGLVTGILVLGIRRRYKANS